MRGGKHLRTQPHIEAVQAMHGPGAVHMRAQSHKKHVQAFQELKHLRAQTRNLRRKKMVQPMQRVKHLRAQPPKKHVQAMRRVKHLTSKPCSGASICEPCGGASICEHNRHRNQCKPAITTAKEVAVTSYNFEYGRASICKMTKVISLQSPKILL